MNPDEILEDADRTTLVGYIGEDLARILVRRAAVAAALLLGVLGICAALFAALMVQVRAA